MESMLQLFQFKNLFNETIIFKRDESISEHLMRFEKQMDLLKIDEKYKTNFLINSLDNDCQYELFSLMEYSQNSENYEWITTALRKLFDHKQSKVSPLAKLMRIKQLANQSTRDFLTQIRINGFKLYGETDQAVREKAMIKAFINGLVDREVANAAATMEFNTLEECYKAVKKENKPSQSMNCYNINAAGDGSKDNMELMQVINVLKNQVKYLINEINQLKRNSYKSNTKTDKIKAGIKKDYKKFICYNCNREGHMANECRNEAYCVNCKVYGHNLRGCRRRFVGVKQLDRVSEASIEQEEICNDESESLQNDETTSLFCLEQEPEKQSFERVSNLTLKAKPNNKSKKSNKIYCTYNNEINLWHNYINGNSKKPPLTYANALKSTKKNKPIVKSFLGHEVHDVFLDSGAELNVINTDLANDLIRSKKGVKYSTKTQLMRCANGTNMSSKGKIKVPMSFVPGKFEDVIFNVVDNMQPNILCGIRQMKKSNILVDAPNNCAWIDELKVNFSNPIYPPTTCINSENELSRPLSRA